jgi:hypothetical protein
MKTLNTSLFIWLGLLLVVAVGAEPLEQKTGAKAVLSGRVGVLERASENRELAAVTHLSQARASEELAAEFQRNGVTGEGETEPDLYKRVGALQQSAARLYGLASTNFDMAAANQQRVADMNARLGRSDQRLTAQTSASNLKIQADQAIELAGAACEKAAVAFDKAGETVEVANASQQAALWQEKLATR